MSKQSVNELNRMCKEANRNLLDTMLTAPTHYTPNGSIDVWGALRELMPPEEYEGYLKGNIVKYTIRAGRKDDKIEDIEKMLNYGKEWLRFTQENTRVTTSAKDFIEEYLKK